MATPTSEISTATTPAASVSVPPSPADGQDPAFSRFLQYIAFFDARTEKISVAAAEQARLAQEKYKADLEFQLERERIASKERIAQIETQSRAVPTRGAHLDPEALAQRIGEVVGAKVQEALEEEYDDSPAPALPPPSPDNATAIVSALKETLAPILSLVVAKLATGATAPDTSLPPLPGGSGGNDPNGEPN